MKTARELAYESIYNIKFNGAYSNIEINKILKANYLKPVDRGFFTELVYGTIEKTVYLDYVIQKFANIPINKISQTALVTLEMALYQIKFLDAVEEYAAVNESVNLCKKNDIGASGFVNAILRTILKTGDGFDIKTTDKQETMRIKYSVSKYIVSRLSTIYGDKRAEEILASLSERPKLYLRTNLNKISKEKLKEMLELDGVDVEDISTSKVALKVKGLKSIDMNKAYLNGLFTIQDLSSMICVEVLSPKRGEKILDLCACPGGKTTYIGELQHNEGQIHAMDISESKLKLTAKNCKRLELTNVKFAVNDGSIRRKALENSYDKVLIDAPCSGFGVIRRKPEIRYKEYEDIKDLPKIQLSILNNGGAYVKNGGVLLYSTCTIDNKENERIVEKFLSENKDFAVEEILHPQIKSKGAEFGVTLMPDIDGTDGFFMAKLRKKGE